MATVESWYWLWVDRLMDRLPRHDWPPDDAGYWHELLALFGRYGVRQADADAALSPLFESSPEHLSAIPAAILALIRQAWASARPQSSPTHPEPPTPDYRQWDREADAHWSYLAETEREEWRQLVRQRMGPWIRSRPAWLEGLAKGWAIDPTLVVGNPPPREGPSPKKGEPRRIFS